MRSVREAVAAVAKVDGRHVIPPEGFVRTDDFQSRVPVGLGFLDRDFRYVRVNDTLAAINGLSAKEHIGRTVAEVVPSLWPELEPTYRHVIETGEAILDLDFERPAPAEPGVVRRWLTSFYPVVVLSLIHI